MKAKKNIRRIISMVVSVSVMISLGFLSFVGMLAISPLLVLAISALLVTVFIEGEVYRQSITKGIKKLFSKDYVKQSVIERELKELAEQHVNKENTASPEIDDMNVANKINRSKFLEDYSQQLKYVNQLRSCKNKGRSNLYVFANKEEVNLAKIKGNAILLIGEGNSRTAYFVNDNEYITAECELCLMPADNVRETNKFYIAKEGAGLKYTIDFPSGSTEEGTITKDELNGIKIGEPLNLEELKSFLPNILKTKRRNSDHNLCVNIQLSEKEQFLIAKADGSGPIKPNPKNSDEEALFNQILIKARYTQENYRNAKKQLKVMQKSFIKSVYDHEQVSLIAKVIDDDASKKLTAEIQRKNIMNKLLPWVLYIGSGISFFFASIDSMNLGALSLIGFFGLTIPSGIISIVILSLAVGAAIGYCFLILNNISDIITHNKFKSLQARIAKQFEYHDQQSKVLYALRCTGITLLLIIALSAAFFATIATAGTWWLAVKEGSSLLPFFAKIGNLIRNVTVPLMGLPSLLFNITNSLETVNVISELSIKKRAVMNLIINKFNEAKSKESLAHLFNPFRFLSFIIKMLFQPIMFIAHSISSGVMSDRMDIGIPVYLTALPPVINETTVDAPFIFGKDEHGHSHGNFMEIVLHIVLSPIYILSAGWHKGCDFITHAQNTKSFFKILKSYYGIENQSQMSVNAPEISPLWGKQKFVLGIEKQMERCSNDAKREVLVGLEKEIVEKEGDLTDITNTYLNASPKTAETSKSKGKQTDTPQQTNRDILSHQNRLSFFCNEKFIKKIVGDSNNLMPTAEI
jgi:hypothetical protein